MLRASACTPGQLGRRPIARVVRRPLLLTALFLASLVWRVEAAEPLKFRLCLISPVQLEIRDGLFAPMDFGAIAAAVATTAVEHINTRNYTLVPDGEEVLGKGDIKLEILLVNLKSISEASLGPMAVKACAEMGGHYLIGSPTAAVAQAASLMSAYYGIPQASCYPTSPVLSDGGVFPLFHRTITTHAQDASPVLQLINTMDWQQVALLYTSDVGGEASRNVLETSLGQHGVTVTSYPMPRAANATVAKAQLEALVASGNKVVLMYVFPDDMYMAFTALRELELDMSSMTWIYLTLSLLRVFDLLKNQASNEEELMDLIGMMNGWLALGEPTWDDVLATLHEAYSSIVVAPLFDNAVDVDGTPVEIVPAAYAMAKEPTKAMGAARMYDSVWSSVGALVKAASSLGLTAAELAEPRGQGVLGLGSAAHAMITGGNVSFHGASGNVSFLPNGDRDASSMVAILENYVHDSLAPDPWEEIRISATFSDNAWVFADSPAIVWPDGTEYPESIPEDGTVRSNAVLIIATISAAIMAVLACAIGLLVYRNKQLHSRVRRLQKRDFALDMDSPVAKMIIFLRRYQNTNAYFGFRRMPTTAEAAELEDLIFRQGSHLNAPDVARQLVVDSELKPAVVEHLLTQYTGERARTGPDASRRPLPFRSKTSPSLLQSRKSNPQQRQQLQTILSDLHKTRSTNDFHPSSMHLPPISVVVVPSELRPAIACDLFLDCVTPESPLKILDFPLVTVLVQSMTTLNLSSAFPNIEMEERLERFARQVEKGYATEGYHCALHAADVTNRLAAILNHTGIATASDTVDHKITILGAVLAAVLHDYQHPQVNNSFLKRKRDRIALEFNDQSLLEMLSLRSAFKILTDEEGLNFMSKWAEKDITSIRTIIIDTVLATDMVNHFDLLGQFATQVGQAANLQGLCGEQKWHAMDIRQRMLTLKIAMKVADIGHCYASVEQHQLWSELLQEEFFLQGDQEKAVWTNASPLMDRNLPGSADPQNQLGFFKVIALPLVSTFCEVFPECDPLLTQAMANFDHWTSHVPHDDPGPKHA